MANLAAEGYGTPSRANIVFFSNDPSHYLIDRQINNDTDSIWIKHYIASEPLIQHPSENLVNRLVAAYMQRVVSPAEIPQT